MLPRFTIKQNFILISFPHRSWLAKPRPGKHCIPNITHKYSIKFIRFNPTTKRLKQSVSPGKTPGMKIKRGRPGAEGRLAARQTTLVKAISWKFINRPFITRNKCSGLSLHAIISKNCHHYFATSQSC
ncbi:hypothetical protein CDAR_573551 [Caerostris darwini]|uniref:Uncharacterized protein n=1 Tax=Caerostris darwini TaxID=1538125 RepID=A0AAV4T8P0_9ARAC|nr:hypothetical protein CDAR_573551 [Caerostris darwini]